MMYRNKSAFGFAFLTMTAISTNVGAAITSLVNIDFVGLNSTSWSGIPNIASLANGNCPTSIDHRACYYEDGMAIGVLEDTVNFGEHLHKFGSGATAKLQYHADSSGYYFRAIDSSAFSLNQLDFSASINGSDNPGYDAITNPLVAGDFWEILGFSTALNPNLSTGDGTDYATRIAYQQVANGFNGVLELDSAFHNINAFWIHFNGYPGVPQDGVSFGMSLDNVQISAPVPVPTAVWLFASGLLGLVSTARKTSAAYPNHSVLIIGEGSSTLKGSKNDV
jgi:hypothetical protein